MNEGSVYAAMTNQFLPDSKLTFNARHCSRTHMQSSPLTKEMWSASERDTRKKESSQSKGPKRGQKGLISEGELFPRLIRFDGRRQPPPHGRNALTGATVFVSVILHLPLLPIVIVVVVTPCESDTLSYSQRQSRNASLKQSRQLTTSFLSFSLQSKCPGYCAVDQNGPCTKAFRCSIKKKTIKLLHRLENVPEAYFNLKPTVSGWVLANKPCVEGSNYHARNTT